jgi:hypothetical protein
MSIERGDFIWSSKAQSVEGQEEDDEEKKGTVKE